MNWLDRFARKGVRSRLARLEHGGLTIVENDAEEVFGDGRGPRVTVHDPRFWRAVVTGPATTSPGSSGSSSAIARPSKEWRAAGPSSPSRYGT